MSYTAGPWEINEGDGIPIANVGSGLSRDEIEANACLIAAAPDLLAALKELREVCAAAMRVLASDARLMDWFIEELGRLNIDDGFGVRAQAAITKAEPQP